jgi:hypothetical protein
MTAPVTFTFVQHTKPNQTARERELRIAAVKSHVTSNTYRLRHALLPGQQIFKSGQWGTVGVFSLRPASSSPRRSNVEIAPAPKALTSPSSPAKENYDHFQALTFWQHSHGLRQDPFDCIPDSRNPTTNLYLNTLLSTILPQMAHISSSFGVMTMFTPALLGQAANYPDVRLILLANVMRTVAVARRDHDILITAAQYQQQAMRTLRKRLSEPGATADDGAILTIILLALYDESSNESSHRIHSQQVETMVSHRDGIEGLQADNPVKVAATQYLSRLSSHSSIRCLPSPQAACTIHFHRRYHRLLPRGFRALTSLLPDHLLAVIAKNVTPTSTTASAIQEVNDLLTHANEPTCSTLYVPSESRNSCWLDFDKIITLAVMRYLTNTFNANQKPPAVPSRGNMKHCTALKAYRQCFRASIPGEDEDGGRAKRRALIWCILMSVDSNWYGDHEVDEMGQDLLRLLKWRFEEMREWELRDFEELGREFFWTESIQRVLERWWVPGKGEAADVPLGMRTRTRNGRAKMSQLEELAVISKVQERDLLPWDGGCCFLCCGMGAKFGIS